MAMQPRDYRFQGQVPMASIMQAYQNKAKQEFEMKQAAEQAKQQKVQETLGIIQQASQLVQQGVQISNMRQQKTAQTAFAQLLLDGNEPFPTGTMQDSGQPGIGQVPFMGNRAQNDPTFKMELASALQKADPESFQKGLSAELAKSMFGKTAGGAEVSGRDIQQYYLVDKTTGNRKLVSFVETANGGKGQMFDALSGAELGEEERQKLSTGGAVLVKNTPQVRTDAAGNIIMVDSTLGEQTAKVSTGVTEVPEALYGKVTKINHPSLGKEDRQEIVKEIQQIKKDPSVTAAKKMLPMLKNVEDYLDVDNKVAIDRLGGLTQKLIALDSGNLAQWEQRDPGARDYITRLKQWASMSAKGKLNKENKKDMVEVLQITRKNIAENTAASVGIPLDSLVELYPQMNKKALYKMSGVDSFLSYIDDTKKAKPSLDSIFGD